MIRRIPPGAPIVSAAQMQAAERTVFDSGGSQDALMERAGAAVARETARLAAGRPVSVLAGPGNNGGDAYVAARLLADAGLTASVAAMGAPKEGASARVARQWRGPVTTLQDAARYPVVLDGLLGIGRVRPFDADIDDAIHGIFETADLRIAIDVPSGVDADIGTGGLAADVTIALGALKPGNLLDEGGRGGHILLADIGVTLTSRWSTLPDPDIAPIRHDTNKFRRGMVVVVAGEMPGAAWLAATGALHAGAGYVVLAGFDPPFGAPHAVIRKRIASVRELDRLLDDERIGAVVIGPGLGRDDRAKALLAAALRSDHDLVVDGDALTLLGRTAGAAVAADRRRVCLTPHAGEFARMFDLPGNKIEQAVAAAAGSGAWVVYKGPDTVIALPDGDAIVAGASTPWLGTAGSGDVLAGLIAARMASDDVRAGAMTNAIWLHTRAAAMAGPAFSADDLVRHLPAVLARACRGRR